MTKKLTYQGKFKSSLLLGELRDVFPEWGGVTSEGTALLESKPDGTEVYVYAPDASDEQAIQVVIDAHDPTVLTKGEIAQIERQDVMERFLQSSLNDKSPDEIYTLMQNRMDAWASLADARDDLREWLPLMAALIVHNK